MRALRLQGLISLLQETVTDLSCGSADGKLTKSGIAELSALKNGASTPKAVSESTGKPLFKVRMDLYNSLTLDSQIKLTTTINLPQKEAN